jgi:hypothetical protein
VLLVPSKGRKFKWWLVLTSEIIVFNYMLEANFKKWRGIYSTFNNTYCAAAILYFN